MVNKQKLELTWIGKDTPVKVEPRILVHDPTKDYGDKTTDNMLIYGDNLLALKALEQDYAGKIKCIYIDPPYNTGSAFEHYDDNLEHSTWLSLMKPRLELLRNLLADEGVIFVQIDDNEQAYLKVLMDEVFGREGFVNNICVKMSETSGVKMMHVKKRLPKLKEYVLVYKKRNLLLHPIKIKKEESFNRYLQYYNKIIINPTAEPRLWILKSVEEVMIERKIPLTLENIKKFKISNASHIVYRTNNRSFEKYKFENPIEKFISPTGIEYIWWEGKQMLFLSDYIEEFIGDLWTDISTINLNKEGHVIFQNGKKPEQLIERILSLTTTPGDLVLDSFLGSGTTAAVAHKMGRKYIGIELGEHCHTHCIPRLQKVIDGTDQGGISKAVNWQGGGGFKYYYLAPSLLNKDQYGQYVISKEYNADMLAAAVAKNEGFKYAPSQEQFWKQGQSSEADFIYTTTNHVGAELLSAIAQDMKPGESLLICCKSFDSGLSSRFANITVKKIPAALLGRCEFGKDNYNLNIINPPVLEEEEE